MIFPLHCKFIGVVDKDLRKNFRPDDQVYFSSQYVILFESRDRCEIYAVQSKGEGFMRTRSGMQKIAETDETLVYDELVDITNRSCLINKAIRPAKVRSTLWSSKGSTGIIRSFISLPPASWSRWTCSTWPRHGRPGWHITSSVSTRDRDVRGAWPGISLSRT